MINAYILDENDEPLKVDLMIASNWFENNKEKRVVALTKVEKNVYLSTVFLVFDHSSVENNVILYESLWFGGQFDQNMKRYSTKKEALIGHNEMIFEYELKLCGFSLHE